MGAPCAAALSSRRRLALVWFYGGRLHVNGCLTSSFFLTTRRALGRPCAHGGTRDAHRPRRREEG